MFGERTPFSLLLGLAALCVSFSAQAHRVGLSRGTYRIEGGELVAELRFARSELACLLPSLDRNGDGTLDAAELGRARRAELEAVVDRLSVRTRRLECPGVIRDARPVDEDGALVVAAFRCGERPAQFSVRFGLLDSLPVGHRHLATYTQGDGTNDAVLFRGNAAFQVTRDRSPEPERWFVEFLRLGIEHIATGYDHLVFLAGLLLIGGPLRRLLLVVTAFTLAHSISLALSALEIVHLAPRWVEPAIALSIAYVGIENLWLKDATQRWRVSFLFGLVHGLGFAGALVERGLPKDHVPLALCAFNLGVETGQLAVLAMILPLFAWALRSRPFERLAVRALSALVILAGLGWFVQRVS